MIYFFYPSKTLGGAELLILRTANLMKQEGHCVTIVDIKNGWLSKNSIGINTLLISTKKIKLNKGDVLITPANQLYKVDAFFKKSEATVILWVMQGYNVILAPAKKLQSIPVVNKLITYYINHKKKKHISNLKEIIHKNGLIMMDDSCENILFKEYRLNCSLKLPVYINMESLVNTEMFTSHKPLNKKISCTWLGRIDLDFKIHILKKVLIDLNFQSPNYFITFNVIGNGPGLENLKHFCSKEIKFPINFLGELQGEKLNSALLKSDIGFAMGTSALNLASLQIPTILLDFSYKKINNYKYRWLFESSNYSLGRDIAIITDTELNKMHSLESILENLKYNHTQLGQQSLDYANKYHSELHIYDTLMKIINKSELTINDLYKYKSTKPFWMHISTFLHKIGL